MDNKKKCFNKAIDKAMDSISRVVKIQDNTAKDSREAGMEVEEVIIEHFPPAYYVMNSEAYTTLMATPVAVSCGSGQSTVNKQG